MSYIQTLSLGDGTSGRLYVLHPQPLSGRWNKWTFICPTSKPSLCVMVQVDVYMSYIQNLSLGDGTSGRLYVLHPKPLSGRWYKWTFICPTSKPSLWAMEQVDVYMSYIQNLSQGNGTSGRLYVLHPKPLSGRWYK